MRRTRASIPLLAGLCLLFAAAAGAHPKTDIVILDNGDTIHGEIKYLDRGKLQLSTSDMGKINIEWEHIDALESTYFYRVSNSEGERFYGRLSMERGSGVLRVIADDAILSIPSELAVEIQPIEDTFWSKFNGSMSFGFSFTKASDVAQLTFDWTNKYRTELNLVETGLNVILTDTRNDDEAYARRIDLSLSYYRLLAKQGWTAGATAAVQRNDELDLRRRLTLGLSAGINLISSNRSYLITTLGTTANSELPTDTTATTESIEAVIAATYAFYRYDTPKTDITTTIEFFPSLTEANRYRAEYDLTFRYELFSDFYIDISYYYSFDSQPVSGGEAQRDYGIITSLSWTY